MSQLQSLELPQYGPADDPARRHRSMPPMGLKKDPLHLSPEVSINADTAVVDGICEVVPERAFFGNTIVPTEGEIAKAAYALYEKDDCRPGQDAENWAKAEAQLDRQRNS